MGYGIPAAIGACMAGGGRQVVCLVGDGGAMVNLQELQTIAHHKLPIAIFVFVNNGYMTMQYTQETHFGREAASSPQSGMSCPNFRAVAASFGISSKDIESDLQSMIEYIFETRRLHGSRPFLCEVPMPSNQLLQPRVQSKTVDGKFVPVPIHDMWPYLSREELAENMQTLDEREFSD
jgi:acetolactate synthase-1/2/3 large subunit